jgi:hypothetical protein
MFSIGLKQDPQSYNIQNGQDKIQNYLVYEEPQKCQLTREKTTGANNEMTQMVKLLFFLRQTF